MESLAVRYRPKLIDDVVGQEEAKRIIQGIFKSRKIPATILISGPSGTGKTTLSRIIARTINCEKGIGCGKCDSCKLFDMGNDQHNDFLDTNVGSERGIDTTRKLAELSTYSPMFRHRFILLDEVHALTPQSASALLKTLEEPSELTSWILATTNPEKLLKTIVNRCVHLQLKPVPIDDLSSRLKYISKKEGVKLSSTHTKKMAEYSGGMARDAIAALEKILLTLESKNKPNKKDIKQAIEDSFSSSNDMELSIASAGILMGLYEKNISQPTIVHGLSEITDFVGMVNKMAYMNGFMIYHIMKQSHREMKNPYYFSMDVKNLLNALSDELKDKKSRNVIFEQALITTRRIESFRERMLTTSVSDPRSLALSIFCNKELK